MFIFRRPLGAVAAGLAIALAMVCLAEYGEPLPADGPVVNMTRELVPEAAHAVSSAPVRDLSLSCRLPPAPDKASWLPSLKSRIVLDQVAERAPTSNGS